MRVRTREARATAPAGRWVSGRWVEDASAAVAPRGPVREPPGAPEPPAAPPARRPGWRPELPIRWEISAYAALFGSALLMRLWDLGSRAVHHDESLHGLFAWQLYQGQGYTHNPLMHGPFQFHGMAAIFLLFGDSDFTLRLLPALFGSALVLLPWLLRGRLGNIGALAVAGMLAFSPTLLYFSRFARNDIYMAVWTLGLVAVMWRYIDERRPKWLYIGAAFLALGFATKETEYLVVVILGLALLVLARGDVPRWIWGRLSLREWGPAGGFLVVLGTLTLPLIGAFSGILQRALGITLAASNGTPGVATGAPDGVGYPIAIGITLVLVAISAAVGMRWNRGVWLRSAAVFWFIFVLLYSTVGTNMVGVGSGIWQSLGYWIAQQGVARGDQPWYYYFILVSVYEFLPWVIAVGAGFYYLRKGDRFARFLVFWALATFVAYTMASEKMPWLLVNITLPLIVLAGKALGEVIAAVQWRRAARRGALFVYAGVPLALILVWRLIFFQLDRRDLEQFAGLWAILVLLALLLVGFYWLTKRIGRKPAWSVALTAFTLLMVGMTVRAAWLASYVNGDVPRDMLIYTQTAPDIPELVDEIHTAGILTGKRDDLNVTIDGSDGFTWPWAWYLRDYKNVGYPQYIDTGSPQNPPPSAVAVVNAKNYATLRETFSEGFSPGRKIVHRWWFPEVYRDLTPGQFFGTIFDRDRWRTSVDFFLYRKLPSPIGGVDSYVYFSNDLPLRPLQ